MLTLEPEILGEHRFALRLEKRPWRGSERKCQAKLVLEGAE